MKLFSFFVLVIFGVTASNATFHRKNNFKHFQFTMDVNGFHNHNHGLAFHQLNGQFGPPPPPLPMYGPPPPPVYGPPPFPHFHHHPHHHPHHKHTPDCNHKPEEDVNNPTNLPADPLPTSESTYDTNTIRPLDANTVFYPSGLSTSTPSIFNADNKPQYTSEAAGPTDATTSQFATNNKNNDNNYNGNDAAIATNNDTDITNNNQPIVPGVSEPTVTPSSTQGNYNGLDYDIDVRFGDSKPNNSSNQKPVDTIK
ncbi:pollen-specific leucine-rich repeat extensin-like protein 1 isoform X2 [Contarinia nasturtii]|uniref:pollen-specific leucine-rich repeat extensin-like protein 1 isoform X2 n=1 Tax=Contarinia nasturtii TaxID=265458 RepID=UPI0012D48814|nr:pollen-specific leucine-rich repeat extensin-like protein 1 isoform X2 [Contarinia nasturtii]